MYYDTGSALFWYKLIFTCELFIAEFLFSFRLNKKSKYPLRLCFTALLCFAVAFAVPIVDYNALFSSLLFFILFFLSTVLLKTLCYDESWLNVFFCTTAAYLVQHTAFETYNFIVIVTGLNNGLPVEAYGDKMNQTYDALVNFLHFESYLLVYWLCFLAFGRRIRKNEDLRQISGRMVFLSITTVLIAVVLNALVIYYGYSHADLFYLSILCLLILGCCIFVLCMQFNLLARKNMQEELSVVKNMWAQEEKQYFMLKENIDYINIKCHDFKHQIRKIGRNCSLDEAAISSMTQTISIYDSALKTGNAALDVLLMEKNLTCLNKGIRLTCIADGSLLSFMEDADVYSLLGNGLDNAIEFLESVEEEEKRVVGLIVKATGSFVSVHLYNYCPRALKFKDGLPVTTHKNTVVHGFGMKSMRMIAEKYGGTISVALEQEMFNLDFLFSIPRAKTKGIQGEA